MLRVSPANEAVTSSMSFFTVCASLLGTELSPGRQRGNKHRRERTERGLEKENCGIFLLQNAPGSDSAGT